MSSSSGSTHHGAFEIHRRCHRRRAIMGVGAASAADMPARTYTKAPPAPGVAVYNWTGFYVGVNGGGGWGRTDWFFNVGRHHRRTAGIVGRPGRRPDRLQLAGRHIGCSVLKPMATGPTSSGSTLCPQSGHTFCCIQHRDLASFRGRVGWATGPVLFYGTGGGAYASAHYSVSPPRSAARARPVSSAPIAGATRPAPASNGASTRTGAPRSNTCITISTPSLWRAGPLGRQLGAHSP